MLKLSITLPNSALITLESDGAEPVHEALALILKTMQLDSQLFNAPQTGPVLHNEEIPEKGNGVPGPDVRAPRVVPPESSNGFHSDRMSGMIPAPVHGAAGNGWNGHPSGEVGDRTLDLNRYSQEARQDYVAFCEAVNPTGDMRRVVVAIEAAGRFFGLEGITADEVGELFDLIGWRRANNFTQTIRNAARSKFGWLERIPGRAGRYAATDVGRSTTLSG